MTTRTERKKAKIRFILLYAISLLLIVVLLSAFWQKLAPKGSQSTGDQASDKDAWFVQIDTTLHAKMGALDRLAQSYVRLKQTGSQPDTAAWFLMRQSFGKTLDSIDQQAGYLSDGPKKTVMNSVAANFRKALETRQAVMAGIMNIAKSDVTASSAKAAEQLDSLRRSLGQKEATIASLQQQAQLAATTSGSANTGLQNALAERDKSITSLQGQVTSLQNQLRQKEAALQSASATKPIDNSGKDKAIATLQGQVAALQNQLRQKESALQAASTNRPVDNSGKDKTIATLQGQVTSLQSQLKQKDAELRTASAARPAVVNNGGEWQQKYQSLKSSFDKVAASEKSLKGAYQSLADDNRRLLSQLQSARKG